MDELVYGERCRGSSPSDPPAAPWAPRGLPLSVPMWLTYIHRRRAYEFCERFLSACKSACENGLSRWDGRAVSVRDGRAVPSAVPIACGPPNTAPLARSDGKRWVPPAVAAWRGSCVRLLVLAECSPDGARTWRESCKGKLSGSCSGGDLSPGGTKGGGSAHAQRTHSQLLDLTSVDDATKGTASGRGERPRRMFVQLLFDANASGEQAWHLEIRWTMCQSQKVEELSKCCARRAKQAGLLLLQVPTTSTGAASSGRRIGVCPRRQGALTR